MHSEIETHLNKINALVKEFNDLIKEAYCGNIDMIPILHEEMSLFEPNCGVQSYAKTLESYRAFTRRHLIGVRHTASFANRMLLVMHADPDKYDHLDESVFAVIKDFGSRFEGLEERITAKAYEIRDSLSDYTFLVKSYMERPK